MFGGLSAALNIGEAKKSRKWQEKMRASAYQVTVRDLRMAGLNPILAVTRGPSAMPMGAQARVGQIGEGLVSSAKGALAMRNELRILRSGVATAGSGASKAFFEANKSMFEARTAESESILRASGIPAARALETMDKTKFGNIMRQLRRVRESVPLPFIGGASAAKR